MLLQLDFPSMAWDLEQFIDGTAAFFSLSSVASVLKTVLTYTGYVVWMLGKDKVSKPQGMADGRNALQGVGIMSLINPLKNKAARTRKDSDGAIQMVGVEGAEAAQEGVKMDPKAQAEMKGLKYPLQKHTEKWVRSRAERCAGAPAAVLSPCLLRLLLAPAPCHACVPAACARAVCTFSRCTLRRRLRRRPLTLPPPPSPRLFLALQWGCCQCNDRNSTYCGANCNTGNPRCPHKK
jgi:hypothetical protein